jgi:hypothetical protein
MAIVRHCNVQYQEIPVLGDLLAHDERTAGPFRRSGD